MTKRPFSKMIYIFKGKLERKKPYFQHETVDYIVCSINTRNNTLVF